MNGPRRTLRPARYYSLLALRTALLTFAAAACFSYAVKEGVFRPSGKTAARRTEPETSGGIPELPMAEAPPPAPPQPDSLGLIKVPPVRSVNSAAASSPGKGIPRLVSQDSGRWFSQVKFRQAGGENAGEKAERRYSGEEAVEIPAEALSRKIKVKGAGPVSAAAAKRYDFVDKEAEKLRRELVLKTEADNAARKALLRGKLALSAAVLALGALLIIAGARLVSAWRSIHKPDGTHWTLK